MLAVQEYLNNPENNLEKLSDEYGIKLTYHDTLPLVILNYSQIDSPKTHPISMECRSLVLELHTWKIVSKSFNRFFNYGEALEITDTFNWSNFSSTTKEDGSLISLFNYNGEWMIITKSSFADSHCGFSNKTWKELFFESFHIPLNSLWEDCTYVFEYCSLHNKIVKIYQEPKVFLLAIINKQTFAEYNGFNQFRPTEFQFKSLKEVEHYIRKLEIDDPTNEGLVLKDDTGLRLKIKNRKYLSLHKMRGENDNLFNPKNLLPWVIQNEGDEILQYFPEVADKYFEMKEILDFEYDQLVRIWNVSKHIRDRKEFALSIKDYHFRGILFQMLNGKNELRDLWINSEKNIYKNLFEKNKK